MFAHRASFKLLQVASSGHFTVSSSMVASESVHAADTTGFGAAFCNISTTEAILDIFIGLVFSCLPCFPFGLHCFLILSSLWWKMSRDGGRRAYLRRWHAELGECIWDIQMYFVKHPIAILMQLLCIWDIQMYRKKRKIKNSFIGCFKAPLISCQPHFSVTWNLKVRMALNDPMGPKWLAVGQKSIFHSIPFHSTPSISNPLSSWGGLRGTKLLP